MPTYRVPVTRNVTESTTVTVDADTPEKAEQAAVAYARRCADHCRWAEDDVPNDVEIYCPDADAIQDVDVVAAARATAQAALFAGLVPPFQVTAVVAGGVVTDVDVVDAAGTPVPHVLTVTDHDEPGDADGPTPD